MTRNEDIIFTDSSQQLLSFMLTCSDIFGSVNQLTRSIIMCPLLCVHTRQIWFIWIHSSHLLQDNLQYNGYMLWLSEAELSITMRMYSHFQAIHESFSYRFCSPFGVMKSHEKSFYYLITIIMIMTYHQSLFNNTSSLGGVSWAEIMITLFGASS